MISNLPLKNVSSALSILIILIRQPFITVLTIRKDSLTRIISYWKDKKVQRS